MRRPTGKRKGVDWDAQPLGVKSDYAIAKELGVSDTVVWHARTRRGIPPVRRVRPNPEREAAQARRIARFQELRNNGWTNAEIAVVEGISAQRVATLLSLHRRRRKCRA